jgi:hypothetical protein
MDGSQFGRRAPLPAGSPAHAPGDQAGPWSPLAGAHNLTPVRQAMRRLALKRARHEVSLEASPFPGEPALATKARLKD